MSKLLGFLFFLLPSMGLSDVGVPLVVAHRGASREAPENTLPAFQLAWRQGADAIEGDFHRTRDGKVVCIHDPTTGKVANRNLKVADSTLAELKQLDVGVRHGMEFKGTTIPTLAEVLATVPAGKRIYIEIKCGTEVIPELLEEIGKSGLQNEQIVLISFHQAVIRQFKESAPAFKAFWLSGFKKDASGAVSPSLPTVLKTLSEIDADGLSSSKDLVDPEFIRQILNRGYEYHVWTIDDPQKARQFQKWGARSITTNVPSRITFAAQQISGTVKPTLKIHTGAQ
jgi:glycerophosphoryl diester phosphodiesterase